MSRSKWRGRPVANSRAEVVVVGCWDHSDHVLVLPHTQPFRRSLVERTDFDSPRKRIGTRYQRNGYRFAGENSCRNLGVLGASEYEQVGEFTRAGVEFVAPDREIHSGQPLLECGRVARGLRGYSMRKAS